VGILPVERRLPIVDLAGDSQPIVGVDADYRDFSNPVVGRVPEPGLVLLYTWKERKEQKREQEDREQNPRAAPIRAGTQGAEEDNQSPPRPPPQPADHPTGALGHSA
jgi:hypothetical protein